MQDEKEYIDQLRAIYRKWTLCFIPLGLSLLGLIILESIGDVGHQEAYDTMFPGFILTVFFMFWHCIATKCPRCKSRFYSIHYPFGSENYKRPTCQSCGLCIPKGHREKSYKESNGDEWNQ